MKNGGFFLTKQFLAVPKENYLAVSNCIRFVDFDKKLSTSSVLVLQFTMNF